MENSGKNFYEVLENAKKLGFAERNPVSDLNGNDSAAKLRLLSSIAFGKNISKNKILTEGIQNINLIDGEIENNYKSAFNLMKIKGKSLGL